MTYDIPYMLFDFCYPSTTPNNEAKEIVRGTAFYDVHGGNVWDTLTKSDLSEMGDQYRNQYAESRRLPVYQYYRKHPFSTIFLAKKLNDEGVFMKDFSEIGEVTGKIFYLLGEKYLGAQPTPIEDGIQCRVVVIDPNGRPSGCGWVNLPSLIHMAPKNTGINLIKKELKANTFFRHVFPTSDGDGDRWLVTPASDLFRKGYALSVRHLYPDPAEYSYEFAFTAFIQATNNPKYIHAVEVSLVSVGKPSNKEGRIDLTGWDVFKPTLTKSKKFHHYYKPIEVQLEVDTEKEPNEVILNGKRHKSTKQLCESIMSML